MKKLMIGGACAMIALLLLFAATQVDKTADAADIAAVESLGVDCDRRSFNSELICIRDLHSAIFTAIPDKRCFEGPIEPAAFLARGFGCCYDHARLIETALTHFGFETRHVAMHVLQLPVLGYFAPADSHAASEVLTGRGWMYVDSLEPFFAVTKAGLPINAVALRNIDAAELAAAPQNGFFGKDYTVLYGLYSRHGRFYPPYVPLPDVNWREALYNFQW